MTATRTKRILSVQPVSDGGGSETALIGMIRDLTVAGWECHVALPLPARLGADYEAAGAVLHGVPIPRLTTSGHWLRWIRFVGCWPPTVVRLAVLARRSRATVVHSNSLHSWHGWAAALLCRRPHVWHAREIVFQSPAALRMERLLARRCAARVIAVSQAVAAQLDPTNVVVVTDTPDPTRFKPSRAGAFRAPAGVPDATPLVGSVARLDVWKGFEVLLDAFPLVRAARPEAELVIAGGAVDGKEDYAARLRHRAEAMPGIRWLGHRKDVPDLLADLDVFAQVSTEPEPFGLVVAEALASGVPVVAGDQGGPLEILGRQAVLSPVPAGRLVPPGDPEALAEAIVALLPDRSSSAIRAQRRPLIETTSGRFAEVFDAVIDSGSQRRPSRR